MRAVFFLFFSILSFFVAGQSDDRVKLRDLQAATGDGQVIQSINDTSRWVVPPWADSISVLQDSIVVLYSDGSEVARDTVGPFGGATTVYYQTLRDDGTPLTQRDAINFVATSTVATTLTDDAGNGETEVALSVPTGGIGATELASTAVTPGSYTYGGFTVDADGRLTAASSGTTPVTGSGTTNIMAKWTGTNTLGNSLITDNGTRVVVSGTTLSQSLMEVIGPDQGSATRAVMTVQNTSDGANPIFAAKGSNSAYGIYQFSSTTSPNQRAKLLFYNPYVAQLETLSTSGFSFVTPNMNGYSATGIATNFNFTSVPGGGSTSVAASIKMQSTYTPSGAGNNKQVGILVAPTINQATGPHTGISSGITISPTLTNAYDFRGIEILNSTGTGIYQSGTALTNFLAGSTAIGAITSPAAKLHVTGSGATSASVNLFAENSAGTDLLYLDNSGQLGLLTNLPARTLHVAGEARITDLTTDAPTRIVGADADGDLNEITVSSELLLSGGVLSVGTLSHAALSDLGSPEDDHDQYLNIFGRAGGQIVYGATGASENLDLNSTTNATKGNILLQDEGGNVIIGGAATASRLRMMEASGSGTNYTEFVTQAQAANVTYTLPADDGDAGEQLQTNGSGSLSWQPPGGDIDFEVYDVAGSYTYNIPTGAKAIDIITIGGGGGGGSGRKGATTDANTGGGGGGGGGYSRVLFVVSQLSASSLDIDVGAGGTGGASVSTSSTNGSGGADGEITTVYCSGFLLCAGGPGDGGGGGSTGASTGGVDATIGDVLGQNGGSCATDGVAAAGDASNNKAPGGGGSGGGIPAGGTPAKNGSRSAKYNYGQDQITNNGTVASPDAGDATANAQQITGGGGGAGGASSIASSGGDGGDGIMGSGGGGGGAALNGVGDSGAGGAGGTGWVLLIVKY